MGEKTSPCPKDARPQTLGLNIFKVAGQSIRLRVDVFDLSWVRALQSHQRRGLGEEHSLGTLESCTEHMIEIPADLGR